MKSEQKIKDLLGDEAYDGKELNKTYIASKIFKDKTLLDQMNAIVHPAVRRNFMAWVNKQQAPYVIQEAAIIFENDLQQFYDKVILVTAPEKLRIKRVMERDGIPKSEILARIANQWQDTRKIQLSDFVIHNLELEDTTLRVNEVHKLLLGYSRG